MSTATTQSRVAIYNVPLTPEQQALVEKWQYLVPWYLARYCAGVPNGYYRESLESALLLALIRAVQSYDPGRAVFSTHATWKFRGAYSAWLTCRFFKYKNKIGEAKPVEIPVSDARWYNLTPADSDPFESRCYEDRVERDTGNEELVAAMQQYCGPREWDMLTLKHQEGWTLRRIGEKHGLSRERVRQILEDVAERLQAEFGECVS